MTQNVCVHDYSHSVIQSKQGSSKLLFIGLQSDIYQVSQMYVASKKNVKASIIVKATYEWFPKLVINF